MEDLIALYISTSHNLLVFFAVEDGCYYPNTSDLSEYVLNNAGQIWVGNDRSNWGRPWQFGQFTKDSLEVALWIVDRMPVGDRSNPIEVNNHIPPP